MREETGKTSISARVTRVLIAAAVVVLLIAAVGYPVYVRPQVDPPREADAILVVGGADPDPRYEYAFDLARQGWAPHLVVSDPDRDMTAACAAKYAGFTAECFVPDPRTTLGEARELRRLAAENHWRTVIVVAYPPHISRARFIMGKCYDGELIMTAAPTRLSVPQWAWMYVYQSAGYVKSLIGGAC
ncbi:YdcF family protein [soil metagenome]